MTRWVNGDELAKEIAAEAETGVHGHASSAEVSTGSAFADALVKAMDEAGVELKRLAAENDRLRAFARKVSTCDEMFSSVLLARVRALHELQREAAQLLEEGEP